MDLLRPLHISSSSGIIEHGILRNSVFGVSAHQVRQETSFSIRYGGVSLHKELQGNLKNSTTGVSVHGNLRNSVFGVSVHRVLQKTSFSIRYGGVSLRTGTSKTPLPEFLRMGTSETPFLEFLLTECARKPRSL